MHRAYLVLFFLFICSNLLAQGSSSNLSELGKKLETVEANDKEQCLLIIKEIFKELPESQILQFVKIQTSLTTHRMAWAHLSHLQSQGKEKLTRDKFGVTQEKFEASIKGLLEKDIEELTRLKKAKELERANSLFNEYAKNLGPDSYRTTLSKLSPSLRQAINRQLDEKGSPSIYKVNAGDIAILKVLADGEDLRAGKKGYRHIQTYKDERGNLNIARMVNSSLNGKVFNDGKSTDSTSDNIASNIEVFKRVIENHEKELNELINGMLPSNQAACLSQKNFCDAPDSLDSNLASFLIGSEDIAGLLQEEIQSRSQDQAFKSKLLKALHYCENWLHTDTQCLDPNFRDQFCDNCSMQECKEPKKRKKKKEITTVDNTEITNTEITNKKIVNETIINRKIINETIVNKEIDDKGDNENVTTLTPGLIISVTQVPQADAAIMGYLYSKYPQLFQPGIMMPTWPPTGNNPGGFNPGGFNPGGGNIPGGTNPGGNNNPGGKTTSTEKKKATWGINLQSKVDKLIGAGGENISTTVTVGKVDESKEYCVNWLFPSGLSDKNEEYKITGLVKAVSQANLPLPLKLIYAPYQKEAYKVKADVCVCGSKKKLATASVEIKRAWEGGSFSCKYNPANWNLDVCNPVPRNLVPFRSFSLSGTDGNQGF